MNGYLTDAQYNSIYSLVPRICVDLIIKTHSGVHLIKRDIQPYRGKYHLPGGRVRFRESIDKAVHRIAKAEIGIRVQIVSMLGYMEFTKEIQNHKKRHSISLAFVVRPLATVVSKKYPDRLIHPVHYKFLKAHKLI